LFADICCRISFLVLVNRRRRASYCFVFVSYVILVIRTAAAAAAAAVAVAVAADASRVSRAVSRNLRANQIITNAIEAREKIQ